MIEIGKPFDTQDDEFYVSEWGMVSDESTVKMPGWIKFLNDTITSGLQFEFSPQDEDIDTEI